MTSYLFPDAKFSLERLQAISSAVGQDKLVVDVRSESFTPVYWADVADDWETGWLVVAGGETNGWLL